MVWVWPSTLRLELEERKHSLVPRLLGTRAWEQGKRKLVELQTQEVAQQLKASIFL